MNKENIENLVYSKLSNEVWYEVETKIWDEVWGGILNKIRRRVSHKVILKIKNEVVDERVKLIKYAVKNKVGIIMYDRDENNIIL